MIHKYPRTAFMLLAFGLVLCKITFDDIINEPPTRHIRQSVYPGHLCLRRANSSRFFATAGIYGKLLCDGETEGGGWVIILKRYDGKLIFSRTWDQYKYGFGDISREFWLGNMYIHMLTGGGNYDLRIDMVYKGEKYYAKYKTFKLCSEEDNFRLRVNSFTRGDAGDSLSYHNNSMFSTYDRDNNWNINRYNCTEYAHAPWWYYFCQNCLLFGSWKSVRFGMGVNWKTLTGYENSLDYVEMKIKFNTKWY